MSGWTRTSAERQGDHNRESHVQNRRSAGLRRGRRHEREHHELLAQGAAQKAAGEPKVGEQGAASFGADAVRLARAPSSVNQSDSDGILGPDTGNFPGFGTTWIINNIIKRGNADILDMDEHLVSLEIQDGSATLTAGPP